MRALITKRIVEPLQTAMKQGLTRQELALTLATGVVIATFPVFGVTMFLCMLVAARLELNQVVIQIANYAGYPLQFLLFIPLIRLGESLFGLESVSIDPGQVAGLLWQQPLQFLQTYGLAIGAACLVWLLLAIPVIWVLKKLVLVFISVKLVS